MSNYKTLFEGHEVEGRRRGLFTLFVPANQPTELIVETLLQKMYSQVYFGASFQSAIDWDQVREVYNSFPTLTVTVEVAHDRTIPDDIASNNDILKVITVKHQNISIENQNSFQLKVENDNGIFCYNYPIYNDWTEYINDRTL